MSAPLIIGGAALVGLIVLSRRGPAAPPAASPQGNAFSSVGYEAEAPTTTATGGGVNVRAQDGALVMTDRTGGRGEATAPTGTNTPIDPKVGAAVQAGYAAATGAIGAVGGPVAGLAAAATTSAIAPPPPKPIASQPTTDQLVAATTVAGMGSPIGGLYGSLLQASVTNTSPRYQSIQLQQHGPAAGAVW